MARRRARTIPTVHQLARRCTICYELGAGPPRATYAPGAWYPPAGAALTPRTRRMRG